MQLRLCITIYIKINVMKKIYYVLLFAALVVMSCGGQKQLLQQAEVEINIPCSGPEFQSSKEYFRANAYALSTDMMMAKKKALAEARAELATALNTTVKRVTDNYSSSYQVGEQEEAKSRFEDLSRSVVNEKLTGTRVICEKMMKTPDGKYKAYVAVELAGEEIARAMDSRIKNDDKLRVDYEYEKFKKVFDNEMESLTKEQNSK